MIRPTPVPINIINAVNGTSDVCLGGVVVTVVVVVVGDDANDDGVA